MKNLELIKETMSSIEIAELTGKEHKNVMAAIRTMEPSWEKVYGLKFKLIQRISDLGNGRTRLDPCYELSKVECLYIATKFNDEARAKLVIRWEQLETKEQQDKQPLTSAEIILQMAQLNVAHEKRIVNVEQELNTIKVEREQAVFDLDYLPVADDPVPGMSLRKKILAIVNAYTNATQAPHRAVWDSIYKKLYYNYGVSLKRCKRLNKHETWMEVAERKGHLDKIYTIVSEYVKSK